MSKQQITQILNKSVMGNSCKTKPDIREFVSIPAPIYTNLHYKSGAQSIRMGEVQRLRSPNVYNHNKFVFVMPIKESQQIIKVQCPVVTSYSDNLTLKVPILAGTDTVRLDVRNPPIIDTHDTNNDRQLLHKFLVRGDMDEQQRYCVKVYPFSGYYDNAFKIGLYQASLYKRLEIYSKNTILRQFFVLEKGKLGAVVFVFNSFLCTLEDVLLYRKYANMPYTKQQQNYIADQILQKYKVLDINNIVHRDIRPSKIYLAESSNTRNPYLSNSGHLGYELLNLQSARRLTQKEVLLHGQLTGKSQMLMTVRGVPLFCDDNVRELHNKKDSAGIYDPFMNDRQQLAKTISMIVTLSTDTTVVSDEQQIKKQNRDIHALIKKLQDKKQPLQHIIRQFSQKFGSFSAYNINMPQNRSILQADYNICINHLPNLIRINNQQRIQQATTQMLFALNHREMFSQRMDKILSQNYKQNRPYDNVAVLNRLGNHYQKLGYRDNDYYAEQLNILTMMSQDYRMRGYPTDSIYEQSNQIYTNKFNSRAKTISSDLQYRVENAYRALTNGDIPAAYRIINSAMIDGTQSRNVPIDTQIKLIKAKGIIQSEVNGPDAGDAVFNQGLSMCNNRNNFVTQVQMLEEKSNFQHYLAKNMITRMNRDKFNIPPQMLGKELAKCQALLVQARDIKADIPLKSTVPIAGIYQTFGDMEMIRQNSVEAIKNLNKSYQLLQASGVEVSAHSKLRILNKLLTLHRQNQRNFGQEEKVKSMIRNLQNKQHMETNRNDRRFFDRIRYLKRNRSRGDGKIFKQGDIIPEEDQGMDQDASKYMTKKRSSMNRQLSNQIIQPSQQSMRLKSQQSMNLNSPLRAPQVSH